MQRVDLVVPGLLNLPVDALDPANLRNSTPLLYRLLRFADTRPNQHFDVDAILIDRLGLDQSALPYAHAINPDDQASQMLCRPVFLKSDINNAIVYPLTDGDSEYSKLINDLSEYFKMDFKIESAFDGYWLIHLHSAQPVTGMPHVLTATGKKVSHYLDQAKDNLGWFKLFNEMQMFLFQHEINQQRFAGGLPMINSLWCWGGDAYNGERFQSLSWFCDDQLMRKLGDLYTGSSDHVSRLSVAVDRHDAIVINLSVLRSLKGASTASAEELLQQLEHDYLQPIMQVKPAAIYLHTGGEVDLFFTPLMTWRFWRQGNFRLPAASR